MDPGCRARRQPAGQGRDVGVALGERQGQDRLVVSDAIPQSAKIVELQGDAIALDATRLKNWPKVLPEVMAAPAKQRTPEAEVQFGDHLAVGGGFSIAV